MTQFKKLPDADTIIKDTNSPVIMVRCISIGKIRAGDIYYSDYYWPDGHLKPNTLQECFEDKKSRCVLSRTKTTAFLNDYIVPLWNHIYRSSTENITPLPPIENLDYFESGLDKNGFINLFWLIGRISSQTNIDLGVVLTPRAKP